MVCKRLGGKIYQVKKTALKQIASLEHGKETAGAGEDETREALDFSLQRLNNFEECAVLLSLCFAWKY